MPRRRRDSAFGLLESELLIGSVLIAVTLIGVILSYNASRGLPFVRTYEIQADVPDAAELIEGGSEVRVRGTRVGLVQRIEAREAAGGRGTFARLTLTLDPGLANLPVDSRVEIKPRSLLGAKYLDLVPGRSRRELAPGGRLPIQRALPIVELDEAFNVFDRQTGRGLQNTITAAGDSLAGRGTAINEAILSTQRLLAPLQRVMVVLAAERTDLEGFIRGAAAASRALAPVAGTLGSLLENAAVTFAAFDAARRPLAQAIDELPGTESQVTVSLRRINPVLDDAAFIARAIRPGSALLGSSSRDLADAVEAGTPILRRAPTLADDLESTLEALDELASEHPTADTVRALLVTVGLLQPTLEYANPAQLQCNVLGLWLRNLYGTAVEGDAAGTWLTSMFVFNPPQQLQSAEPAPDLHVNFYPHLNERECEAGNEPFEPGQLIGNPPGRQPNHTADTQAPR